MKKVMAKLTALTPIAAAVSIGLSHQGQAFALDQNECTIALNAFNKASDLSDKTEDDIQPYADRLEQYTAHGKNKRPDDNSPASLDMANHYLVPIMNSYHAEAKTYLDAAGKIRDPKVKQLFLKTARDLNATAAFVPRLLRFVNGRWEWIPGRAQLFPPFSAADKLVGTDAQAINDALQSCQPS